MNNVHVVNHPLCCHNLSIIRNKQTTAEVFRNAIRRITYLLFYKATEDLPLEDVLVEAFATIREAAYRIIGEKAYFCQLLVVLTLFVLSLLFLISICPFCGERPDEVDACQDNKECDK